MIFMNLKSMELLVIHEAWNYSAVSFQEKEKGISSLMAWRMRFIQV